MRLSRLFGTLFVVLFGIELLGVPILRSLQATEAATGAINPLVVPVGTAWTIGVWITYIVFMLFLITWVGEGMAAERAAANAGVPRDTTNAPELGRAA
jgi:hypothetical protein